MSHLRHLAALAVAALVAIAARGDAGSGRPADDEGRRSRRLPHPRRRHRPACSAPTTARTTSCAPATVHRGRTAQALAAGTAPRPRPATSRRWDVKTPNATGGRCTTTAGHGATYTSLFHVHGPEVLDCDGLRGRTLPRQERVVVTVPRACIGNPRWIRFGASMGRETNTHHFIDDARIDAGFFSEQVPARAAGPAQLSSGAQRVVDPVEQLGQVGVALPTRHLPHRSGAVEHREPVHACPAGQLGARTLLRRA